MRPCGPSDLADRSLNRLSITPYFGGAGRTRTHTAYPYALTVVAIGKFWLLSIIGVSFFFICTPLNGNLNSGQ